MILKVDDRGRIVIPLEIRNQLQIDKEVNLELEDNKIIISNPGLKDPITIIDEMISKSNDKLVIECLNTLKKELK